MTKPSRFTPNVFSLVVMTLALAGTGNAMAADATASSTGIVVAPIQITKAADLSFGSFAGGSAGGSVTVSTSGARTKGGGAVLMTGSPGTAAQFDVTGAAGTTYSIRLDAPGTLISGTDTMNFSTVSDLDGSGSTSGNITSGTLSGGTQSIFVGGVLTVAANQAAGTYIGSITATVEYN